MNDAARKAFAILAAGVAAVMVATLLCLTAGIHNGLDPADVPAIRNLFPSLRISDFYPEPLERAQAVAFVAGAYIMSITLVLLPRLDSMIPPIAARLFWTLFAAAIVAYLFFGENAFQFPSRYFGTLKSVWLPEYPALWIATLVITASPVTVHSALWRRRAVHVLGQDIAQNAVLKSVMDLVEGDGRKFDAIEFDPREPLAAAVKKRAVGAAEILGNELPGLVAKDLQMLCRDIGVVDDDVVVIAAADARLRSSDPETRGNIAVTRQYFYPDHLLDCTD